MMNPFARMIRLAAARPAGALADAVGLALLCLMVIGGLSATAG